MVNLRTTMLSDNDPIRRLADEEDVSYFTISYGKIFITSFLLLILHLADTSEHNTLKNSVKYT